MIEFNGQLTGQCKKFLLRKQIKDQFLISLFAIGVMLIPIILMSIYCDVKVLLFLIPFVFLLIASIIPPDKKSQRTFMPKRIFIDLDEQTIVHKCEKMERFHMLSKVKTVVDFGDWYDFKFEYPDKDSCFVCQKDLLAQGTLEEFEALFEGKIVRKIKTK